MGIILPSEPALHSTAGLPSAATTASTQTSKRKRRGVKARAPAIDLSQPGRLRVANLLALYGIASANTLYRWMHLKRIPLPDGRDPRPYWRTSTIRAHLESSS